MDSSQMRQSLITMTEGVQADQARTRGFAPPYLTTDEKNALLAFLHSLIGDNVERLAEEIYPHPDLPPEQN